MKKAIALGLSAVMAAGLVACGSPSSSNTPASTPASGSTGGEGEYAGQTLKVAAIETAYGTAMWERSPRASRPKPAPPWS